MTRLGGGQLGRKMIAVGFAGFSYFLSVYNYSIVILFHFPDLAGGWGIMEVYPGVAIFTEILGVHRSSVVCLKSYI